MIQTFGGVFSGEFGQKPVMRSGQHLFTHCVNISFQVQLVYLLVLLGTSTHVVGG
jgi:hypothetical protein